MQPYTNHSTLLNTMYPYKTSNNHLKNLVPAFVTNFLVHIVCKKLVIFLSEIFCL